MTHTSWLLGVALGMVAATPFLSTAQTSSTASARELQYSGCYVMRDSTGRGPRTYAGLFDSVTALDSAFSVKDAEWNRGRSPRRAVRFYANIPDSLAIDTALNVTTWRLARADTIEISHSNGFGGVVLRVAPSDAGLNGYYFYATDVVDRSRPPRHFRMTARRVACPGFARAP